LFTTDPRTINHVITHSDEFEKPQEAKVALELLGDGVYSVAMFDLAPVNLPYLQGLVFAEGERHRKQVSLASLEYLVTFGLSPSPESVALWCTLTLDYSCGDLIIASPQNPAFGLGQLRSFTPIFNKKATEVRRIWFSLLDESQTDFIKVDFPYYMGRATLDIIGLAGQSTEFATTPSPL
jgi:hypothetical protein